MFLIHFWNDIYQTTTTNGDDSRNRESLGHQAQVAHQMDALGLEVLFKGTLDRLLIADSCVFDL